MGTLNRVRAFDLVIPVRSRSYCYYSVGGYYKKYLTMMTIKGRPRNNKLRERNNRPARSAREVNFNTVIYPEIYVDDQDDRERYGNV